MLEGKKTYLVAMAIAVATYVKATGYISEPTFQLIVGLLGAGGLVTLRSSIAGINNKLIIPLFLLLTFSATANAQVVTTGPVNTTMKFQWEAPLGVTPTDQSTYESRLYDSFATGFTVLSAITCTAGATSTDPTVCLSPLTTTLVTNLNKLGTHNLTLTYFRLDLGESPPSQAFSFKYPVPAPRNLQLIR
jgi:hypothetical protein